MNILPMVFALVLMLSLLTIERLENVKNQMIVQKEYRSYLQEEEGAFFKLRQRRLFNDNLPTLQAVPFKYIIDKKAREESAQKAQEYKIILAALIETIYGQKEFYKKIEEKHSHLSEELLTAIEEASNDVPKKMIRRLKDVSRLKLSDPLLQEAFYHIFKGSVSRDKILLMQEKQDPLLTNPKWQELAYPSLFLFISYKDGKISIQRASREVLKAIFGKDEVVEQIIKRRQELAEKKEEGAEVLFKQEFAGKRREGVSDELLDFKITQGADRTKYD